MRIFAVSTLLPLLTTAAFIGLSVADAPEEEALAEPDAPLALESTGQVELDGTMLTVDRVDCVDDGSGESGLCFDLMVASAAEADDLEVELVYELRYGSEDSRVGYEWEDQHSDTVTVTRSQGRHRAARLRFPVTEMTAFSHLRVVHPDNSWDHSGMILAEFTVSESILASR